MSFHALLLLTALADGDIRMTMSPMETAEACESQREVVGQILEAQGSEAVVSRCGQTGLRLTPYIHGVPPEAATFLYRVEVGESGFDVAPLDATADCTPAPEASPAVYCVRSSQRVLP